MTDEIEKPRFSLFEIEHALTELLTARAEAEEIPEGPEREQALAAVDQAMAEYVERELQKADNIIGFCRTLKRATEAAKEDRDYYARRAGFLDRTLQRMKEYAHIAMEAAGKKRIDGRSGYLLVKNNGGIEPLVISNETIIPDDHCKFIVTVPGEQWRAVHDCLRGMHIIGLLTGYQTQRVPDTAVIRDTLKRGDGVPGAHLEHRGQHVEVK